MSDPIEEYPAGFDLLTAKQKAAFFDDLAPSAREAVYKLTGIWEELINSGNEPIGLEAQAKLFDITKKYMDDARAYREKELLDRWAERSGTDPEHPDEITEKIIKSIRSLDTASMGDVSPISYFLSNIQKIRIEELLNPAMQAFEKLYQIQKDCNEWDVSETVENKDSWSLTWTIKRTESMTVSQTLDIIPHLRAINDFFSFDVFRVLYAISEFVFERQRSKFGTPAWRIVEKEELFPFVERQLRAAKKKNPELKPISADEIIDTAFDDLLNPVDGPYKAIAERALRNFRKRREKTDIETIPNVTSKTPSGIEYPLDKPNSVVWNLMANAYTNGYLERKFGTGKKGSRQDSIVLYSIDFDALSEDANITKQLTPYDKRVYIAAAALYNAGNSVLTETQIHFRMGNKGRPGADDLERINESLTKMGAAHIYIDNEKEVRQTHGNKLFQYDASLLPFERCTARINGTMTEGAIHLFREPPLISFAKLRGQVTTVQQRLLESPISKTDANLRIDDYLIARIAHMKDNQKLSRKILYETVYERCNIATTKQKQRAPGKIQRYIEYYKSCNWITGFTLENDGITILL